MTTKEIQKIQRMADESIKHAHQAMKKSEELQGFFSLLEYQQGKKNTYPSVNGIFKKLKI